MKQWAKRLSAAFLSLALLVTMVPLMSLTAHAQELDKGSYTLDLREGSYTWRQIDTDEVFKAFDYTITYLQNKRVNSEPINGVLYFDLDKDGTTDMTSPFMTNNTCPYKAASTHSKGKFVFTLTDKEKAELEKLYEGEPYFGKLTILMDYDDVPSGWGLWQPNKPATTTKDGSAEWESGEGEINTFQTRKIKSVALSAGSFPYTGKPIVPKVTVKNSRGKVIDKRYYKVTMSKNTLVGTANVKVDFDKGVRIAQGMEDPAGDTLYAGSVTKTFKIVPAKVAAPTVTNASKGFSIYWKKVNGATGYEVWRKKAGGSYVKAATISDPNKLSYWDKSSEANVNGVKYTYMVRAYRGKVKVAYTGIKSYYKLDMPQGLTVKNSGSGKITASWQKNEKATGYKVKYVTGNTAKIKGTAKTRKVLTVTPGKTYKVSVRAYKTVGDKMYYSKFSPAKTITAA